MHWDTSPLISVGNFYGKLYIMKKETKKRAHLLINRKETCTRCIFKALLHRLREINRILREKCGGYALREETATSPCSSCYLFHLQDARKTYVYSDYDTPHTHNESRNTLGGRYKISLSIPGKVGQVSWHHRQIYQGNRTQLCGC
jgi:hypothetical protein